MCILKYNKRLHFVSNVVSSSVFKNEGIRSFWKGNGANCARIIPNKGILFMCNDMFISLMKKEHHQLTLFDRLLSGSLSGAVLISVTYPLDLTTARLACDNQFKGIWHCLSDTCKKEGLITIICSVIVFYLFLLKGFRGLYKGYVPSICGIVPYTGTQFAAFEFFKRNIIHYFPSNDGSVHIWVSLVAGAMAGTVAQTISYPLDTIR